MRQQRTLGGLFRVGVAVWLGVGAVGVAQAAPAAAPAYGPNPGPGNISMLIGVGPFNGDGIAATSAALGMPHGDAITGIARHNPSGVAVDPASGTFYVGDTDNNRVRKVTSDGMITTLAGTGKAGFAGDGGPAAKAQLRGPRGLNVAPDGSVYVADTGNRRIRRIAPDGTITTVAGNGQNGNGGNGGAATKASFRSPVQVGFLPDGSYLVVDQGANQLRRVGTDGSISIFAGRGNAGSFEGDGAPAHLARFDTPTDVAVAPDGNVYVADSSNQRIRRIDPAGNIWTVANLKGTRASGTNTTDEFDPTIANIGSNLTGLATTALPLDRPKGIAAAPDGSLYIADQNSDRVIRLLPPDVAQAMVRKARNVSSASDLPQVTDPTSGFPTFRWYAVAGGLDRGFQFDSNRFDPGGLPEGDYGDGGKARQAQLRHPAAVSVDAQGSVYVLDQGNLRVRKITNPGPDGVITQVAGAYGGNSGAPSAIQLLNPRGVAAGPDGTIYVADTDRNVIRKVTADGSFSTVIAGTGTKGDSSPGGPATSSRINYPTGIAVGPDGLVYWADRGSHRIKRVNADGTLAVVAGTGVAGYAVAGENTTEGALAVNSRLNYPADIAFGPDGNLYVADEVNSKVRKITDPTDPTKARIYTYAGNGSFGYSGEGGPAAFAELNYPADIAFAPDGTLYVADMVNHCVRKVDSAGMISTFAGQCGTFGSTGDGGKARRARVFAPEGIAVGRDGSVYISGTAAHKIRKVAPDGTITTLAGTGAEGMDGNGGAAAKAQLRSPRDLAYNPFTNSLLIADTGNGLIRVVGLR